MIAAMLMIYGVNLDLFHTASGIAYAHILSGRRKTWPIRRKRFRMWLRRSNYNATGADESIGAPLKSPPRDGESRMPHR